MSTHLHLDANVTLAFPRLDFAWRQSPPEGRRTRECKCVDIECPGLAEPRVTFSSATLAGSMPAMAPLRERSRCDRSERPSVTAPYETLTALPSSARGQRLAKAGQKGRGGESGAEPGP